MILSSICTCGPKLLIGPLIFFLNDPRLVHHFLLSTGMYASINGIGAYYMSNALMFFKLKTLSWCTMFLRTEDFVKR